ncbi:MAG TPA: S8 family serine peptidase, partial [Rhodanobacteraceae bacterium]|nr:S8 family serine peptidase [Rhodanobacteraceae bacterium]
FQWLGVDDATLARLHSAGFAVVESAAPFTLDLGGERFDPKNGVPSFAGWNAPERRDAVDLRLVQFEGPVRQNALDALRAAGIEPIQYIHPFTYVVWAPRSALESAAHRADVRWSGDFVPAYRVLPEWRALGAAEIDVHVATYRSADGIEDALRAAGATVTGSQVVDRHFRTIGVRVAGNRFAAIASIPGVYSVQPVPTSGGLRGEMSDQVNAGNVDDDNFAFPGYLDYLEGIGLDGNGVIIADVDGGIFDTHPDLVNRMVSCTGSTCGGSETDSHGTHTAGIMAADGSSGTLTANGFLRGLGMAPGANLVEQLYSPTFTQPGGMLKLMTESYRNHAVMSGNSWGPSGFPQGYDDDTRQVDVGVRDADPDAAGDQTFHYVLSFMNGGGGTSTQGTPDEAKNIFTIGSTWMQDSPTAQNPNIDDLSSNTAHGPALDGRSIPAMVAPGCDVDSTISATGYGLLCGTSMASPHVTGASALFVEYYRNLFAHDPSPALIKAAFTAVAKNLTGHLDANGDVMTHLFDSKQGWGRMQIDPVLAPAHAVQYVDQDTVFDNSGESWTKTFTADDPTQPIRIMLAWTDAPGHGLGGSTPAWNNDLDLRVTGTGGTYLGNVLDDAGWSETGGAVDAKNNTEAVFLQPAQHGGSVTVEVLATDINSDALPSTGDDTDQDFALVCYNCAGETSGADLSVGAVMTEDSTSPGGTIGYAINANNAGPGDASGVHLDVATTLANATFTYDRGSGWSCDVTTATPSCDLDAMLAPGASPTLMLYVHVPADAPYGTFTTTFTVGEAGIDPDPENNVFTVDAEVIDRLFVDGFDPPEAP